MRLDQCGIHSLPRTRYGVQSGLGVRRTALYEAHQVSVHLPQSPQRFAGCRDECSVSFPLRLLVGVIESRQVPEHRGLRRHAPPTPHTPSPFQRPPLPASHTVRLHLSKHPAEPFVLVQNVQIGHRLAACQVQQYQRANYLAVRPTLTASPQPHATFYR